MDIIQLHRIKKKHLKNKQRNTIKYILKKNDSVQDRGLKPMGQTQSKASVNQNVERPDNVKQM